MRWTKRAAVFFGALMTLANVRAVVAETVIRWFSRHTEFTSPEQAPGQTAIRAEPAYIPEGFAEIGRFEEDFVKNITYTTSEGGILVFAGLDASGSVSANNEDVEYRQVIVGDTVYHTFTAVTEDVESTVVWDMDGIRFSVGSALPMEELLRMAQPAAQPF